MAEVRGPGTPAGKGGGEVLGPSGAKSIFDSLSLKS